MVVDSSRVDVGRTAVDDDSAGEGEEQAEVEDMVCVRGIVSYGTGRTVWSPEISYFCKGMMDVLVEGALATPPADVAHFPSPARPNRAKQLIKNHTIAAAATSHPSLQPSPQGTEIRQRVSTIHVTIYESMYHRPNLLHITSQNTGAGDKTADSGNQP